AANVTPYLDALKLTAADPALGGRLRQGFAVQLFLAGRPAEARAMLPAEGSPAEAETLLRDVKTLIAGQGELRTWPARRLIAARSAGDDIPPGLRMLLPEETATTWKSQLREASDPTALDELAALEKPQRERIAAAYQPVRNKFRDDAAA